MNTMKPQGMWLPIFLALILVLPTWSLGNNSESNPDIETLKLVRQVQNQNTQLANVKANSVQVNPSAEEERILRLTNALDKVAGTKMPSLEKSYRFKMAGKSLEMPQIQTQGSREVLFNHGALKNSNDSLYFNFLTGLNSADSIGMDVRITGNEGTNFGNENAGWGDPSLLYWVAEDGNLEFIPMVASVDDPNWVWATVSWDWTAGNAGQPLGVGNIWAVYARTSHMYVALEVTHVDPWGQYFEFDYVIQTDGTNIFDGEPPALIDLSVNGLDGDTLMIGSNPYFEITLGSDPYGEIGVFYDIDHNGMLDDWDPPIEFYEFMDNDMNDEDPSDGVFGFTYTDEMAEGINYLADDLLFVAFNSMDYASVPVQFYSEPTEFSISGTVLMNGEGMVPAQGIIVWAVYEDDELPAIVAITDEVGMYHLDLPATGLTIVGTDDLFGVTFNQVPDPPEHFVDVQGHVTDIDFDYIEAISGIQGYVLDDTGAPLAGVDVRAENDGMNFGATTDEDGFYFIGLNPGGYNVEVAWMSVTGAYLFPMPEWVEVGDVAYTDFDIVLTTPNSFISGTVLLDGSAVPEMIIAAINDDFGYSPSMTENDGTFQIPVLDNGMALYDLWIGYQDNEQIVQVTDNRNLSPGTTGEMVLLETVSGGLFGLFINGETGEPIEDPYDMGMGLYNFNSGMEYHSGPDNDAYYEIYVPEGEYELFAGGMDWYFDNHDTLTIGTQLMQYDIVLWPLTVDASLTGQITDLNGAPIPWAQVQIGNESWGTGTSADETGYYHFELPEGHYFMHIWAEGYHEFFTEVDVYPGENYEDFVLEPFQTDGAIHGTVMMNADGSPLANAEVFAYGGDMGFYGYTNNSGEFWFDLPNGVYDVVVEYPGLMPFWGLGYEVNNDTTYIDVFMLEPDGGLEGVVFDDMGYEIYGAEVIIVNTADSLAYLGMSHEGGYYSIPASNGEYQVFANAEGFQPAMIGFITINNDWVYLDITLMPHQFATPPEIAFIVDQPWDQGRNVRMQFWPGGTEWGPFMGYSVWRLTNTPMGEILDFVDYLPNHDFEAYNLVLPTLIDSNAYTTPDQYLTGFMVTGHWDAYGYIDGMPSAGYSIDNIHPGVPGDLVLMGSNDAGVDISWEASMADDFQYFEVHRALNPGFVDATTEMTTEPMHHDANISVGQTYYYMVYAIDANGNSSEGTNMVSTSIVSVDDAQALPTAFGLSQNYPNPFNPTTSIEFAIPEASQVSLEIYNLLGQRVRTLVNGYVTAGYINTQWDGLDQNGMELSSGTYIYRLKTADTNFSKKMVLMK